MLMMKGISVAPIYRTRWERRALYNNTSNALSLTHTHARTHARTHAHARSHAHTHKLTHARTHAHTEARTHAHTHTHTHTHTHSRKRKKNPNGGVGRIRLQALVYDGLPPTTAVFGYAIGLPKLSSEGFSMVLKKPVCYHTDKLYQAAFLLLPPTIQGQDK